MLFSGNQNLKSMKIIYTYFTQKNIEYLNSNI